MILKKNKIWFVLALSTIFFSSCGQKDVYDPEGFNLQGKVISFRTPMIYAQNWKRGVAGGKEQYRYNRYLMPEFYSYVPYDHHYEGGKKQLHPVKKGMRFTIKKSFHVVPWGLQTAFTGEYRVLVLEDEYGLLSTIPYSMVQDNGSILENN